MQKSHESLSSLIKAGSVFLTTMTSYGLFSTYFGLGYSVTQVNAAPQSPSSTPLDSMAEFRVNTYTKDDQGRPHIIQLNNSDMVIEWVSGAYCYSGCTGQDGSGGGLYAQRYTIATVPLGGEFRINTVTQDSQSSFSITSLASEGFVSAWHTLVDGNFYRLFGQVFDDQGIKLGSEFQVNTTGTYPGTPVSAAFKEGGFILVWYGSSTLNRGIFATRYNSSSTAQRNYIKVNTYNQGSVGSPSVAVLNDDGYVITWTSDCIGTSCISQDGSGSGIFAQRYNNLSIPQGGEFQVNTITADEQADSLITVLNNGRFVIAWNSYKQNGPSLTLSFQLYDNLGEPIGTEIKVNILIASQYNPYLLSLINLKNGGFLISWRSSDSKNFYSIYSKSYDDNGIALSDEFRVNLISATDFSAVSISDDTIFGAWTSNGIDSDVYARLINITNIPKLINNQLMITEGQKEILNNTHFFGKTASMLETDLLFLPSNIMHGQFEISTDPGVAILNFTQQDINQGRVAFIHDGKEFAPSFATMLANTEVIIGPYNATIYFTSVDDAPRLVTNQIDSLFEGQIIIFDASNLNATDVDNDILALVFEITDLQHGQFESTNNLGVAVTNFTQQQVRNGTIRFVHDGGEIAPSYAVTVTDGVLFDGPHNATILSFSNNVNDVPVIINCRFSIKKGDNVVLTRENLRAIDPDNNESLLEFQLRNVQFGHFEFLNNPKIAINSFLQQQIEIENVAFTQDNSDDSPTADIRVSDGLSASDWREISIAFENQNSSTTFVNTEQDHTGGIIGGAVSGATLLGTAIGVGFWYHNYTRDANTRKRHQFADYVREAIKLKNVDNFDSEKGRHYVTMINKLVSEFNRQGGMLLSNMDEQGLKNLAKQVAVSARNKLTASTTLFGYSMITIEDLNNKVSDIVQEVLQARVGQNDNDMNIPMQSFK